MLNDESASTTAEAPLVAVTAVDHLALMVVDIHTAVDWYVRVIGAVVTDRWADASSGMAWAHLDIAGARIELVQRAALTEPQGFTVGPHHLALVVPDCEAATRALVEAGGEVVFPPSHFERHDMDWSFVRDPFGTILELIAYRAPAHPEHP